MWFWVLYPLGGALAGLLAGLLGVGGGVVVVPIVFFSLSAQNLPPEYIMQIALGTSLGTIAFTSVSSFRAHNAYGAVIWDIVKRITPGILIGTFLGTWVATRLPPWFLKVFFTIFIYYVALQMLMNYKPKPNRHLPGLPGMSGVGGVIGIVSSLVGIGGATLSVPFMTWCNVPVHQAIGTSSAIGFPIAVAGTIGYIINGWNAPGLPLYSLGYVFLPALFSVALVSMLVAPYGARLSQRLPVSTLKKIFAFFLIIIATKMSWGLF
ncbi:MAG: sulfite exporter TauE/SafE family protein [Deltaproteobacteria bacterium]|nr:sulfite exporter TauE/SafE family protein [Deltaproteobacteria bacterium]